MVKVKNPFVAALVNIAKSQDIESFKKIFDYFSPRLKSFLMKSGADEAIAEEIIQETMTIIWTKADYYDPKVASPSTWIYTIARNKKIDILRKSRKAILEDIETAVLPPIESKADENIEHDQKFDMVAQYLDDLPADQLNLLKMNFCDDDDGDDVHVGDGDDGDGDDDVDNDDGGARGTFLCGTRPAEYARNVVTGNTFVER